MPTNILSANTNLLLYLPGFNFICASSSKNNLRTGFQRNINLFLLCIFLFSMFSAWNSLLPRNTFSYKFLSYFLSIFPILHFSTIIGFFSALDFDSSEITIFSGLVLGLERLILHLRPLLEPLLLQTAYSSPESAVPPVIGPGPNRVLNVNAVKLNSGKSMLPLEPCDELFFEEHEKKSPIARESILEKISESEKKPKENLWQWFFRIWDEFWYPAVKKMRISNEEIIKYNSNVKKDNQLITFQKEYVVHNNEFIHFVTKNIDLKLLSSSIPPGFELPTINQLSQENEILNNLSFEQKNKIYQNKAGQIGIYKYWGSVFDENFVTNYITMRKQQSEIIALCQTINQLNFSQDAPLSNELFPISFFWKNPQDHQQILAELADRVSLQKSINELMIDKSGWHPVTQTNAFTEKILFGGEMLDQKLYRVHWTEWLFNNNNRTGKQKYVEDFIRDNELKNARIENKNSRVGEIYARLQNHLYAYQERDTRWIQHVISWLENEKFISGRGYLGLKTMANLQLSKDEFVLNKAFADNVYKTFCREK